MIEWTRELNGDLVANIEQKITISGSLSSSYPPHAYWIFMNNKDNAKIVRYDSRTTEDECKELAEEWVK